MKTWSDMIRTQQAEIQDRDAQRETEKRRKFNVRHTPMTERINRITRAMPEEEQSKPRHMDFFTQALAPKYHGHQAHPGEIGKALIKLGWVRRRKWSPTKESQTLWHPPSIS